MVFVVILAKVALGMAVIFVGYCLGLRMIARSVWEALAQPPAEKFPDPWPGLVAIGLVMVLLIGVILFS